MKVIVFDLDNTLCEVGKPILHENIVLLKKLEDQGNQIVLCSGKPTYYLCGLARQLGLNNIILVGENGAAIQFGVDLPPQKSYIVCDQLKAMKELEQLKAKLEKEFEGKIWYQPNEVVLTAFPKKSEYFDEIRPFLKENLIDNCAVYEHIDSFDIVPSGVNKYNGLMFLANLLKVNREDFIAVGDGQNDYPMFEFSKLSLGINVKDDSKVDINFSNINDALKYLLNEKSC